jgi:DNA-binding CsgD family transcriptional regulator
MLISRPSGRRSYIALVSPLTIGRSRIEDRQPAIVVFVSDPERTPELPLDRLSRLYGLTPAEAQLTQQLASGLDLREIAAASNRAMNTVRAQLKQVFHKTGARRQAELVRLVLQAEGPPNGLATARES